MNFCQSKRQVDPKYYNDPEILDLVRVTPLMEGLNMSQAVALLWGHLIPGKISPLN